MMSTGSFRIPVADAELTTPRKRGGPTHLSPFDGEDATGNRKAYFTMLLGLNIVCFLGVFAGDDGALLTLFTLARYALWPMILFGAGMHLATRGGGTIGKNMAIAMPFLAIGILSSMFGFNLFISFRAITFWFLGVLSASVIAAELSTTTVQRAIFRTMFSMIALSILFVFLMPKLALGADTRGLFGGGSWNGIFIGKNLLGWVCGYALIFCAFGPRISILGRFALAGMAIVCLLFSGSQGSVVSVVATAAFVAAVWFLRRTGLSPGARASLLLAIVFIAVPMLIALSSILLELLGRDTTLTGRTDIWQAFFGRAMNYWMIGAGPGSFTGPSPVTIDLSVAFAKYGIINTPHNMFIAAFGETGVFGLIAYVSILIYAAFILPFRNDAPVALATSSVAFMTIVSGIGETREVFGPAFAMFLLILMLSLSRRAAEAGGGEGVASGGAAVRGDHARLVLGRA